MFGRQVVAHADRYGRKGQVYALLYASDMEPGTQVKTFRTDRDTLEEYWDLSGVVLYREWTEKYESYVVAWRGMENGRLMMLMMLEEFEALDENDKLLLIVLDVMNT